MNGPEGLAIVHGSYPEPGKVSEPLRALASILPGSRGEEKGGRGFFSAYASSPQGPLLHCDINLNTSPDRMGCPVRKLRHHEGTEIDPICISSGQCGCQGSSGWRAEGRRVRIGCPSDHSRGWVGMEDSEALVTYCPGERRRPLPSAQTGSTPTLLLPHSPLVYQQFIFCLASVLWTPLPALKDLVKGDINLLLFWT